MIIYFILLLFLLSNISNNKKKSFAILSFTLFLIGFLRTDSVGTDVKSYCNLFDGIAADFFHIDSLQLMYSDIEFGFIFLIKAIKHIFDDSMTIVRVLFLLSFASLYYCILNLSTKPILTLFIYYSLSFYFFSFNGIRQAFAISLSLLVITIFLKHKLSLRNAIISSLWILIIAFFFHKSLVVSIIVPFILKYTHSKFLSNNKLVLTLIVSLLASIFLSSLLVRAISMLDISFMGSDKYSSYLETVTVQESFSYFSNTLHALFAIFLLYTTHKRNPWLQIYAIGTLILVLLSPLSWLFIRVSDNLKIYIILALPFIWQEWKNSKNSVMYQTITIFYCLVLFVNRIMDDNFKDVVPYVCEIFK
ncbi:EpsG family protein [Oscillospiraceae bacterium N12]|jgi:transmembrane protein EpsG|uniref:EpsG family protein n=1 Tax=Jilunia laotingensis TaxID=2763675 RepID=A0A926F320_9BACT|nr:EpsG family protein [Jilunia laotingensis]MBC8592097.1 EpsG family protein [Jilunia laotingensis]